jgi:hypothetical protein
VPVCYGGGRPGVACSAQTSNSRHISMPSPPALPETALSLISSPPLTSWSRGGGWFCSDVTLIVNTCVSSQQFLLNSLYVRRADQSADEELGSESTRVRVRVRGRVRVRARVRVRVSRTRNRE